MTQRNVLVIALCMGIQFSCSSSDKKSADAGKDSLFVKTQPTDSQVRMLPDMKLTTVGGNEMNVKSLIGRRTILILFQPDCDHCQNEARQIAARITKFAGYELHFISSASLPEIEKFSKDYKLSGFDNVHFAKTEVQSIIDNFGPIPAPSIFIYSEKGELVNNFEGEMEIDVVIKYL